jgi:teichuronic acid biosynthesis glycosyltransferase TuaG
VKPARSKASTSVVSVVIPVYNQGNYLAGAIDSVLSQDYEAVELVVVDDGSTDSTAAVIASYADRIRLISQENRGAAEALNRGIAASTGSLVCWLSADDVFLPGKLTAQVASFVGTPGLSMSATGYDVVDARDRIIRRVPAPAWRHPDPFVAVFWENPINGSSVMIRREVFERTGPFNAALRADVDGEMWLRIAPTARIGQLDRSYLRYRVHDRSLSANRALMVESMTRVRVPYIADGTLRARLAGDPRGAAILARMAAEYLWRGYRELGESLLRESADVGVDRSSQGLAQVVRIATRWHAGHAWAMGTAARARRAARRRREGLTGT